MVNEFTAITAVLIACFIQRLEKIELNYMERTSVHCLGYPLAASQANNSNLFPNFPGAAVYRILWVCSLQ